MSRHTSWISAEDLYETLGVPDTASTADLRRAYRLLALAWHPDRAGPSGADRFGHIASAYRILANPVTRSSYDADRRHRAQVAASATRGTRYEIRVGPDGRPRVNVDVVVNRMPRLSGPIARLTAAGVASVAADGTVDLFLNGAEIVTGGTAVIEMALRVSCPSCGGIATPRGVWCRRCEHAGMVVEPVSVHVPVPARHAVGCAYRIGQHVGPGMMGPLVFRFQRQATTAAGATADRRK